MKNIKNIDITEKGKTEKVGVVQTQTEMKVAFIPKTPGEKRLSKTVETLIEQTVAIGMTYIEMCRIIRDDGVNPPIARIIMEEKGMKASRVSEVLKVSMMPDEKWKQIDALQLGFKGALSVARDNYAGTQLLNAASPELTEEAAQHEMPPDTGGTAAGTGPKSQAELEEELEKRAVAFVRAYEKLHQTKAYARKFEGKEFFFNVSIRRGKEVPQES